MSIETNLSRIKNNIDVSARLTGKSGNDITLVCVTKAVGIKEIEEVLSLGIIDIGENRVKDAILKCNQLDKLFKPNLHMIGHLQTNKAKDAVKVFDMIQSVDSLQLADEIDRQALKIGKIQDILIQVNISSEETKFGICPKDTVSIISGAGQLKSLNIKGLMTIVPLVDDPEKVRPYFKMMRGLFDQANKFQKLAILSMGMSNDYMAAIEEGSTMVRIGRAIFGHKLCQH